MGEGIIFIGGGGGGGGLTPPAPPFEVTLNGKL